MNLKILLKNIGEMAKAQKLVNFSAAGASLAEINPLEVTWYPMFYAIPAGTHTITENTTTFSLTLYYIDRLLEDNSNEVDIFSSSIENLRNIINGIKGLPGVVEVESTYTMNNFMPERLNDRLCGSYANVRIMVVNDTVCFFEEPEPPIDYSKEYLTISPLEDGSIIAKQSMEVSSDGGKTWKSVDANEAIELIEGKDLKFRGKLFKKPGCFSRGDELTKYTVYGNIASMHYGEEFSGQTTILGIIGSAFAGTGVVDASNLYLPDPGFAGQYGDMFFRCTSLTTAPALPATTLAEGCYFRMFGECTSLTTAPELPATTLANACYHAMFLGCTRLASAPSLPATTLAKNCYRNMFDGCSSLTTAPALPVTTLAEYCYQRMFAGCASLTTAPELPATTLVKNCYESMFAGCASLNYIKCLATDISATNCLAWWLSRVSPTGTFVKNPAMNDWTVGENGIPNGWEVVDD